ncbi:MAG: Ribosomal RNA small subunit methyltransferase H [candidate division TM6 bacterium GW2011_GWF2_37_49]|nr:MAG: Ribosomal RNA small subunit methyltransferase H [candidate division TM6 bacterium GW2011_GWF2_37_49]
MINKHKSVLVNEVIEYLDPKPGHVYVDVTFGCGGHTKAILEKEPNCKVIGIDWDLESIKENQESFKNEYGDRLNILWGNFANIYKLLKKEKIKSVDGFLADFGTSQLQIRERAGLSFRTNTPLDMRMSKAHYITTAADILNNYTEKELLKILHEYGEESNAKKIVKAIINFRAKTRFKTTGQLVDVIESAIPFFHSKIHPATKTFQAIRIAVNDELGNINSFLSSALPLLNQCGRLVCISFHSLEDRLVKTFLIERNTELNILTRKPIIASAEEVGINPSSRSAKLRAAEKL